MLHGSCLCGGVTFEIAADAVERGSFCHCTTCKRISGGVGTASVSARTDAISVTAGRELLTTYHPAEGSKKTFCSVCGSNLFGGGWPDAPRSSVRLPAIETPFENAPLRHIYTRSVASWEKLPDDGLPRVENP
jgi:hypothetical protein